MKQKEENKRCRCRQTARVRGGNDVCRSPQKLSDSHIRSGGAPCVGLHIYMGPFCGSLEKQVKKAPFCHFIPAFKPPQFHRPPAPTPPLCLCSIKMYQAGWRSTGRRGLFILSPPAHINDLAPVVPRRGDVHINSSHTHKRRGTRVEHR